MSEFVDRFQLRGQAIKTAYMSEDTRPNRPMDSNILVDVMADICIRAESASLDPKDILFKAQKIAEYELGFVADELQATLGSKGRQA